MVARGERILIILLLSLTVFTPVLFLSRRIANSTSSIADKEFVEDLNSIKHTPDNVKLEAVGQEVEEFLKEPDFFVYEDRDHKSIVTRNSFDNNLVKSAGDGDGKLKRNETVGSETVGVNGVKNKQNTTAVPFAAQGPSHQVGRTRRSEPSRSQKATDEKVRVIKDQLLTAKSYLNFAPPNSNSHLVKELRVRTRDLERAFGDARKDSDLSRRALQRMRNMEIVLSKASRVYSDCSEMAMKLRAMTYNSEEEVLSQRKEATYLTQLATRTLPKGLHCLSMQLTADYFSLQPEERELPNKQRLQQKSLYHYALFSNNVLACAVVVNSTISTSREPEKIVFHIVTDALNHPAITMWFLLNPPGHATIQVERMDDFKFLPSSYFSMLKQPNPRDPRFSSALNHLRFYLPEIFPDLNKIVFLDHDVVVQRDLRGLWHADMKGKVNGAVETCGNSDSSLRMDTFINFSNPTIARRFDVNACAWAFGMNVFNLREWRRRNLTSVYHKWVQQGKRRQLWKAGSFPLGLITFYNLTVGIDKRWHVVGLGHNPDVSRGEIERAAVIHYDGSMKPWLETGIAKYRGYWSKFVKYDHPYLQQCNVHP